MLDLFESEFHEIHISQTSKIHDIPWILRTNCHRKFFLQFCIPEALSAKPKHIKSFPIIKTTQLHNAYHYFNNYRREIIDAFSVLIFSADTRSLRHTVHPINTFLHLIHPVIAKKFQKSRFQQTRKGPTDRQTKKQTLL